MAQKPVKVLLAKPGLDGHNRGVHVVARALRDAGMEVIYTGIRQRVGDIVKAAIEEDVDVVGLSNLSGAHSTLFVEIADALKKSLGKDVLLMCGGIIPEEDREKLRKAGFSGIFTPGASTEDIVKFVRDNLKQE